MSSFLPYLIFIEVGVQQLLVVTVNDRRPVRCRKHIAGVVGPEAVQADGLGPQGYDFAICQASSAGVDVVVVQFAIPCRSPKSWINIHDYIVKGACWTRTQCDISNLEWTF